MRNFGAAGAMPIELASRLFGDSCLMPIDIVRWRQPQGEFVEVFVNASLAVAEQRDPEGLDRKARRGELQFTGIDSPYEVPETPEIVVDTNVVSVHEAVDESYQRLTGMALFQ